MRRRLGKRRRISVVAVDVNLDGNVQIKLRELVLQLISDNKSISAKDMTGIDLSELVFDSIDFSHSIFSFCKLVNAKFINCLFEEAILVNADLTHCIFENCNMKK